MIELKVIGCYGAKVGRKLNSTYLLGKEKHLALDAGSLASAGESDQRRTEDVLITDSHKDHWSDLVYFAYNNNRWNKTAKVHTIPPVIKIIKDQGFTRPSWPAFDSFEGEGGIRFNPLDPTKTLQIQDYQIRAIPVNHNNDSALGFLIKGDHTCVFYTGDMGVMNQEFWDKLKKESSLKTIITECSYPNEYTDQALKYKHLSPKLLEQELEKLDRKDITIFLTHFLPEHEKRIKEELHRLKQRRRNINWLEQGKTYSIG